LVRVRVIDIYIKNVIRLTLICPSKHIPDAEGRPHAKLRSVNASEVSDERGSPPLLMCLLLDFVLSLTRIDAQVGPRGEELPPSTKDGMGEAPGIMQQSALDAANNPRVQPALVRCPPQRDWLVRNPSEPCAYVHEARRKVHMELALRPAHNDVGAMNPILAVEDVRSEDITRTFGNLPIPESVFRVSRLRRWIAVKVERLKGVERREALAGWIVSPWRRVPLRRIGNEEPFGTKRFGS
jgi:hypothetical protein